MNLTSLASTEDAVAFLGELMMQRMAERDDVGFSRAVYPVERLGRDADG
jgi:hypothetical protein